MNKISILWWPVLLLTLLATACDADDEELVVSEEDFATMESEWVRLTLLEDDQIKLLQANTGQVLDSVSVPLAAGARYYTSNSGRYLTVTERNDNRLRFFDSGVINHEDHGHQQRVGWLGITVDAPLPTHYASTGGHAVIFNDGDGSITHVNEAQLELPSYEPRVITFPTVAHHGAGFRLDNGRFAITFKNTDEPGGIPQMVKYLDAQGSVSDENGGVVVAGIHGDATNGKYGVFGSTDGVILVDGQRIDLIPNDTALLSPARGFWIGTLKGHDKTPTFFGRAGSVGSFLIDPVAKSMKPVYLGDDIVGDMLSFDGAHYIIHTKDRRIRVYDATTGTLLNERVVEMANIPVLNTGLVPSPVVDLDNMDLPDPVLVATDRHLYILSPNRVDIKVLSIDDLKHVHTIRLNAPVKSIAKNGFTEV